MDHREWQNTAETWVGVRRGQRGNGGQAERSRQINALTFERKLLSSSRQTNLLWKRIKFCRVRTRYEDWTAFKWNIYMYFYIFVYIFHWFSFIPTAATILNFANVVQRLPSKRCLFFYSFLFEVWANCLGNFKVASHAYSANTSIHTRTQGDMCVQWVLSQCSLCRCSFVLAAGRLVSYLLYCNSLMSRITMSSSCHAPRGS